MAPSRSASLRVAATRSAPGGEPASRANSPACGVNTVGALRPATRSGCAARMVSPSASTMTGRSVSSANHRAAAPVSSVPRPGPTAHACTRPDALRAGRGDDFGPLRKHLLPGASRVADHAGRGGHRGAGTQHGGTGIGRRAGQDAGDALGVLVVSGAGHGPAGFDVGRLESQHVGRRQVEADVDQLDAAAIPQRMNGFEAAERHGQRGVHVRPVGGAGVHIDAAGDVDGHHGSGHVGEHLGRVGPQWSTAGDADDAVDHQIGCGRHGFDNPATGLPEGGQRRFVGALRFEQHRRGSRATAAQECRCPQSVAAVVAGADDSTDPAARDSAGQQPEFTRDGGGQPERRAPHESAFGQRRQQRRFSLADRIGGVVVPHRGTTLRAGAGPASEIRPRRCDGKSQ